MVTWQPPSNEAVFFERVNLNDVRISESHLKEFSDQNQTYSEKQQITERLLHISNYPNFHRDLCFNCRNVVATITYMLLEMSMDEIFLLLCDANSMIQNINNACNTFRDEYLGVNGVEGSGQEVRDGDCMRGFSSLNCTPEPIDGQVRDPSEGPDASTIRSGPTPHVVFFNPQFLVVDVQILIPTWGSRWHKVFRAEFNNARAKVKHGFRQIHCMLLKIYVPSLLLLLLAGKA